MALAKIKTFGLLVLWIVLLSFPSFAAPTSVRLNTESNLSMRVPPVGRWVNNYALLANTAKTITVPSWTRYVSISGTNLWVNWTSAQVTVPSGNVTNGSGAVLNTGVRYIDSLGTGVDTIAAITSFVVISATAQEISVECWK
jgi:hypothetical protein